MVLLLLLLLYEFEKLLLLNRLLFLLLFLAILSKGLFVLKKHDILLNVWIIAFKSEIGQGNARQREKILGERGMFV